MNIRNYPVVDMFCGAGGLTRGFVDSGFDVVAGIDNDEACRFPFEKNNGNVRFLNKKIEDITLDEISALYPNRQGKILIGCAPCQPYSTYTKKTGDKNEKWQLVNVFADLICSLQPDIVSMENVPALVTFKDGILYKNFEKKITRAGYSVTLYPSVDCRNYGVPQNRKRMVLFASKFGKINIIPPTYNPDTYQTVFDTIGHLERIAAGESSCSDSLHKARRLTEINLRRIKASVPGRTWKDWDEDLKAACHLKDSGRSYRNVYGRMEWLKPSPTITTECVGFGNGRFGHPEQDRAISLREAALLQTFPPDYQFVTIEEEIFFSTVARLIGNAVPVVLGKVIADSIKSHLEAHDHYIN